MVDIKPQKEFNLKDEVKPIVLANNLDNALVKEINEVTDLLADALTTGAL